MKKGLSKQIQSILFYCFMLSILTSGCSHRVTPSSRYGPLEQNGQGVVAYNPDGLSDLVRIRRDNALKQAYRHCGNSRHYKILKEETRVPTAREKDSISGFGSTRLTFISYKCDTQK